MRETSAEEKLARAKAFLENVPAFKPYQRPCAWLLAKPGLGDLAASKFGGMFLWPQEEPWPKCTVHPYPGFYLPILQLNRRDIKMDFAPSTDLLQIFWAGCDDEKNQSWDDFPEIKYYWRNSTEITHPLQMLPFQVPPPPAAPAPCLIEIQEGIELPSYLEIFERFEESVKEQLSSALDNSAYFQKFKRSRQDEEKRMGRSDISDDDWAFYEKYSDYQLVACDCDKVGGWGAWLNGSFQPQCAAGHPMSFFLSINAFKFRTERALHQLDLGDGGVIHFFVCRQCPGWPIHIEFETT